MVGVVLTATTSAEATTIVKDPGDVITVEVASVDSRARIISWEVPTLDGRDPYGDGWWGHDIHRAHCRPSYSWRGVAVRMDLCAGPHPIVTVWGRRSGTVNIKWDVVTFGLPNPRSTRLREQAGR